MPVLRVRTNVVRSRGVTASYVFLVVVFCLSPSSCRGHDALNATLRAGDQRSSTLPRNRDRVAIWATRAQPNQHVRENHRAATRLLKLTQQMADDVQLHSGEIGQVHSQLTRVDNEKPVQETAEDHMASLIHHLSLANERLQARLTDAESNLQHQAAEFAAQLTEARTDALTGLANRRSFDEELTKRFSEWSRYGQNVSLILLDADRFKDINDQHGHLTGDAVLTQLADILATARETDIVTRYGGEEFAIVLPHTGPDEAVVAAERLRTDVAANVFTHEGATLSITISYGIANFEPDDDDAESVVARADTALYASKAACRNNGHRHDGRVCLPIRPTDEPDAVRQSVNDAATALQQRVHELVAEAPSRP